MKSFGLSDEAFEAGREIRKPFTRKQQAMYDLWVVVHRQAWNVCIDASPRVLDKLIILHEMTNPDYRRDPIAGAAKLEQFLAANEQNLSYQRYVGPVISQLLRYAAACGQHREYDESDESEAEQQGAPSGAAQESPEHISAGHTTTAPAGAT